MRKISEYRQHAKECRLGEAIEISRAPADASEHGRHMGNRSPTIVSGPQKAWSELPSWKKPQGGAVGPRNTHADADRSQYIDAITIRTSAGPDSQSSQTLGRVEQGGCSFG